MLKRAVCKRNALCETDQPQACTGQPSVVEEVRRATADHLEHQRRPWVEADGDRRAAGMLARVRQSLLKDAKGSASDGGRNGVRIRAVAVMPRPLALHIVL